jgi:hypothetical protein
VHGFFSNIVATGVETFVSADYWQNIQNAVGPYPKTSPQMTAEIDVDQVRFICGSPLGHDITVKYRALA